MQKVESPPVEVAQPGGEKQNVDEARPARRGFRWWVSSIALGVFAALVALTLVSAWMRWGQFDPALGSQARERVGIGLSAAEHPWYFPMLVGHVMGASVALATVGFQVWPWLRRRHPRVHRYIGRVYVFAGVYPAVVCALMVQAFWPFSVVTSVSQVVLALLWGSVTTYGFVLRRRGRIEDHRRWMIRSFALTCFVLVEMLIEPWVETLLTTQLHTRLASSEDILVQVTASNANWLGLTLVIITVEWWLERERLRDNSIHT